MIETVNTLRLSQNREVFLSFAMSLVNVSLFTIHACYQELTPLKTDQSVPDS